VLDSVRLIDLKGKLGRSGVGESAVASAGRHAVGALVAPLEIAEQSKSYLDRLPEAVKGIYPLSAC